MHGPKFPLIENYRHLVAQSAWKAWRVLPKSIQTWISIEDMIEDGMFFAYRFAVKRFDSRRASFITGFHVAIHNFFIREYVEMYGANKRGWEIVKHREWVVEKGKEVLKITKRRVPIGFESMNMVDRSGEEKTVEEIVASIPALQIGPDLTLLGAITECITVPGLIKVHSDASPVLKDAMIDWFITRKSKTMKKSPKFKSLAKEFRELCAVQNIHCDDCIHLMRSPICMDSFSRQLTGIPYDLNDPCPAVDGVCGSNPAWFRKVSHELGTDKCA